MSHCISSTSTTSTTTPSTPLTFNAVAKLFTEKANAIVRRRKLAGPGLEYANIAVVQGAGGNVKINPVTGLQMHRNNPKGVKCTNALCASLPHADNHDIAHCYWPGSGMESRAPAWIRNKSQKPETVAVAMTTSPNLSSSTPQNHSTSEYQHELSCVAITKLPDTFISTLLDSGTTSHLITNQEYFIDFRTEDNPGVQTANHRMLCTTGRGTCVADLILRGEKYRVTLHDCLHALDALTNLLSVGRMLEKEHWTCGGSLRTCGRTMQSAGLRHSVSTMAENS